MICKTQFVFDDRIYWTFIQFVTFHKSLSSTGQSRLLPTLHLQLNWSVVESQSKLATDSQSVGQSALVSTPSEAHDQIFITVWQLRSCYCGTFSLKRERVCVLHMLLVLANAFHLVSEYLETPDYILVSEIWHFPFRRLLRLAGSRGDIRLCLHTGLTGVFYQVKVTLWQTVSQSVCLGVETRLRLMTRCFFLFECYFPVHVARRPWREVGSVIC
jgi:hypothetical protein